MLHANLWPNLYWKGRVPYHIAFAFESHKFLCWTHNTPGVHAEIQLLRRLNNICGIKWNKILIYVVRVKFNQQGQPYFTLSKPCVDCARCIQQTNARSIYWSTDKGSFEKCKPCNLTSSHISKANRWIWRQYDTYFRLQCFFIMT